MRKKEKGHGKTRQNTSSGQRENIQETRQRRNDISVGITETVCVCRMWLMGVNKVLNCLSSLVLATFYLVIVLK